MRPVAALLALPVLAAPACHPAAPDGTAPSAGRVSAEAVTLTAADGVQVAGVETRPERARAMILLFHQAESSKDEYALIAPRLAQAGYASLRIDQRAGGPLFGRNETAGRLGIAPGHVATPAEYLGAMPDLRAALRWAEAQRLPVILWGSSYSASLALLLAAERPQAVRAVLAFSPGEYLADRGAVARAAARIPAPVFVTTAQEGHEIDAGRAVIAALPAGRGEQFVPKLGGVHGSSTLLRTRNPEGAEPTWKAVMAFLDRVTRGNS
jgi:dienelactone hydrolase